MHILLLDIFIQLLCFPDSNSVIVLMNEHLLPVYSFRIAFLLKLQTLVNSLKSDSVGNYSHDRLSFP